MATGSLRHALGELQSSSYTFATSLSIPNEPAIAESSNSPVNDGRHPLADTPFSNLLSLTPNGAPITTLVDTILSQSSPSTPLLGRLPSHPIDFNLLLSRPPILSSPSPSCIMPDCSEASHIKSSPYFSSSLSHPQLSFVNLIQPVKADFGTPELSTLQNLPQNRSMNGLDCLEGDQPPSGRLNRKLEKFEISIESDSATPGFQDAVSTTDEAFASTFSINSDPKTPPHFFLPTLETAGTNSEVGSDNCEGSCAPIGQLIVNQTNSDVLSQTTDDLSLSCEHISSNGHMEIQSLQDKPQFSTDQNYHHLYRHSLRAHRTYCVTPKRLTNWYQSLSPSYKSKVDHFRRLFTNTPVDTDHLLVDYSCALSKNNNGFLMQGRMYITEHWVCFYSKIIYEHKVILAVNEIISITKAKTAKVFPNAIQIVSMNHDRYFFTSFAARERTYLILRKVWENGRNKDLHGLCFTSQSSHPFANRPVHQLSNSHEIHCYALKKRNRSSMQKKQKKHRCTVTSDPLTISSRCVNVPFAVESEIKPVKFKKSPSVSRRILAYSPPNTAAAFLNEDLKVTAANAEIGPYMNNLISSTPNSTNLEEFLKQEHRNAIIIQEREEQDSRTSPERNFDPSFLDTSNLLASCFVPLESTLGSSLQDSTDSRPQLVANISCESSPAHGAHKSCEITNDPSAELIGNPLQCSNLFVQMPLSGCKMTTGHNSCEVIGSPETAESDVETESSDHRIILVSSSTSSSSSESSSSASFISSDASLYSMRYTGTGSIASGQARNSQALLCPRKASSSQRRPSAFSQSQAHHHHHVHSHAHAPTHHYHKQHHHLHAQLNIHNQHHSHQHQERQLLPHHHHRQQLHNHSHHGFRHRIAYGRRRSPQHTRSSTRTNSHNESLPIVFPPDIFLLSLPDGHKDLHLPPAICSPGHTHEGRVYADSEIPLGVDALFTCLFTDSTFFDRFCETRGTFDLVQADWPQLSHWPIASSSACSTGLLEETSEIGALADQPSSSALSQDIPKQKPSEYASSHLGQAEVHILRRTISYTLRLKQKIGPRTCSAVEEQTLLISESQPGIRYALDAKVTNEAVPLCNCFHVISRYCLLHVSHSPALSRFTVSSRVVYDKPVFFGAKSIIETTCKANLTEYFAELASRLVEEASRLAPEQRLSAYPLVRPPGRGGESGAEEEDGEVGIAKSGNGIDVLNNENSGPANPFSRNDIPDTRKRHLASSGKPHLKIGEPNYHSAAQDPSCGSPSSPTEKFPHSSSVSQSNHVRRITSASASTADINSGKLSIIYRKPSFGYVRRSFGQGYSLLYQVRSLCARIDWAWLTLLLITLVFIVCLWTIHLRFGVLDNLAKQLLAHDSRISAAKRWGPTDGCNISPSQCTSSLFSSLARLAPDATDYPPVHPLPSASNHRHYQGLRNQEKHQSIKPSFPSKAAIEPSILESLLFQNSGKLDLLLADLGQLHMEFSGHPILKNCPSLPIFRGLNDKSPEYAEAVLKSSRPDAAVYSDFEEMSRLLIEIQNVLTSLRESLSFLGREKLAHQPKVDSLQPTYNSISNFSLPLP